MIIVTPNHNIKYRVSGFQSRGLNLAFFELFIFFIDLFKLMVIKPLIEDSRYPNRGG